MGRMAGARWAGTRSSLPLCFVPILILLALGLVPFSQAQAKSYTMPDLQMQVVVTSEGDVQVEEQLSFDFKGKFGFAFRDIPLAPGHQLTAVDVAEPGIDYRLDDREQPGSFILENHPDRIRVTWYYKARNEQRTFTLTYTLQGAVARHVDVAEFYMKFVGDQWDRPIGRVLVDLRLPAGSISGPVQAWGHGPLHGNIEVMDAGRVRYQVSPLPAHTFWEGRVLFSPALVNGLASSGVGARREAILAEEAQWALEANRRRDAERIQIRHASERAVWQDAWAERLWPVAMLLGLMALGIWFLVWRSIGRPHQVAPISVPGERPSQHPPAVVARLLTGTVGARALVATLLDLARRGYYRIEEKSVQRSGWFGSSIDETDYIFTVNDNRVKLLPMEQDLVDFVHGLVGQQKSFRMSDLKKAAKGKSAKLRRWFEQWRRSIGRDARKEGLMEPPNARAMVFNGLCGAAVAAGGVFLSVLTSSPAGVPAIIGGGLQLALTAALTRHTPDGRRLYLAWNGFKKQIREVSRSQRPVAKTSSQWEDYLTFAVVFGYHQPLSQILERSLAGSSRETFPWFVMMPHGQGLGGVGGLADGVSTMVGSVTTTMSSATGSSGGASGGGGGGAGGGGGGAG